jgi:hypothetical protein
MKIISIALMIIGIAALMYGGISYNRQKTILDVGGVKATATEHKTIPISPLLGAIALIGGVWLLVGDKRRGAPAKIV